MPSGEAEKLFRDALPHATKEMRGFALLFHDLQEAWRVAGKPGVKSPLETMRAIKPPHELVAVGTVENLNVQEYDPDVHPGVKHLPADFTPGMVVKVSCVRPR